MHGEKPRQIAVRILTRTRRGSERLESVVEQELASSSLSAPDRALLQELVFGVTRWQATLDWLIARKTGGRTQKQLLQVILRLGLYQLFWLERIPDHAAVHESVELARRLGCGPQSGFINALLRGCLRERAALHQTLSNLKLREPHLGYSHPQWLCDRWQQRWGDVPLRTLLEWNNSPAPVYARVNALRTQPEQLAAQFEKEGVLFTPRSFPWAPPDSLFELRAHPPLAQLPSLQQGLFYVQDPSTLLAPAKLETVPGLSVLDLCSAPGGKTTFLAQLMHDQGLIQAEDNDSTRLERLRQNCLRLGVTCVHTVPGPSPSNPSPEPLPAATPLFDRVLVDAPCSNTGVMRRRVELRWRVTPEELARLSALQLALLQSAAPRTKAGGLLVYSTCSLEPEENGEVTRRFLATAPSFTLQSESCLTPFVDGVDGAYVAVLRKG